VKVSDENEPETIGSWFNSLGVKIKIFFGAIIGLFGLIAIFLFQKKITSRQILELELEKLREEIEIEKAQEEINKNNVLILDLEGRIKSVKEEIDVLDSFEAREEVSKEELDEFFDDRGF
jgi:DNA gyrase/topoisomerase IV subunit A